MCLYLKKCPNLSWFSVKNFSETTQQVWVFFCQNMHLYALLWYFQVSSRWFLWIYHFQVTLVRNSNWFGSWDTNIAEKLIGLCINLTYKNVLGNTAWKRVSVYHSNKPLMYVFKIKNFIHSIADISPHIVSNLICKM